MQLWTFLTTDIRELNLKQAEEVTKAGADTAKAVIELAKTVKDQGSKIDGTALQPYIGQFSSLLDVLNSPLAQIVKDAIPFAPLAVGILKLIAEATKQDPTLEQCMMLVSQTAYLDSLRAILEKNMQLLEQKEQKHASKEIAKQLQQLGKQEFSDQDAQKALLNFPHSRLAQAFNKILQARLQEAGFSAGQARVLCDRITWNTNRLITQALAKAANPTNPLVELYRNGGRELLERHQSIEKYLREHIQPLPDEVIFREESTGPDAIQVTYRDLYMPLKGQPLDCDGRKLEATAPLPLDTWMVKTLNQEAKAKHLLFIQGEAGRGKSVFCRMVAAQVQRTLYPSYIPILIRLRGLRTLATRLQDTLASAPELQTCDFVASDAGWLTDANTRFLFLLDGFDELLLEGRATGGLKEFLQQVEQFQKDSHHRFVITGRPLALLQVERLISQTRNIERIGVQPMDDGLTQKWMQHWAKKVGQAETQRFWQFLKACPQDVQTLAREPLLLYLLARMHREQKLSVQLFAATTGLPAKIQIYDAAIQWVLEKQRQHENFRLTGLEPDELRQFLAEAATCVVQSGNEVARISMLEARLRDSHSRLASFLKQARQQPEIKDWADSQVLNNLLTSFYLKPASGAQGGCIEFVHKSFGEFLFAERVLDALKAWTKQGGRRPTDFLVCDQEMYRELYGLLGYGGLTPDIISYLTPRLVDHLPPVALITLFERLNDFYDRWCEGEFIDGEPPTLPQETMRQFKAQGLATGQRQVDVYTGLNVMILLLELHRYAQDRAELKAKMVFYPDGQLPEGVSEYEWTTRLLRVIHYSEAIVLAGFSRIAGAFFAHAHLARAFLVSTYLARMNLAHANLNSAFLNSANLASANLASANLASAHLNRVHLNSANLASANLARANLVSADLTSATLMNADLTGVNLTSADLNRANLTGANLIYANFDSADLYGANLTYAILTYAKLIYATLDSATLTGASLTSASLTSADLRSADLTNADLANADLENIIWDETTTWDGVRGLGTARNVPEALKQQLGLTEQPE